MEISREGISSTELTEYSVEERFIKLPIENYLKTTNRKLSKSDRHRASSTADSGY